MGILPARLDRAVCQGRRKLSLHTGPIQVTVAGAVAIVPGKFLSVERRYWAIIIAFLMLTGAQLRGDGLDKCMQHVAGTLVGVGVGILIVTAVSGACFIVKSRAKLNRFFLPPVRCCSKDLGHRAYWINAQRDCFSWEAIMSL